MAHEHDHDDHDHEGHDHEGHDHHGHDHDHDDEHGRFSTGQEEGGGAFEKEHRGDFAEGQQIGHTTVHDDRGDFAEGQEGVPGHEHGQEPGGDYSRGHEHEHE